MKLNRALQWLFLHPLLFICASGNSYSQTDRNTVIKGQVTDAKTHVVLPYVSVLLENTTVGTITDIKGLYNIVTSKTAYKISFSFLGYEPESRIVTPGKTQTIDVEMIPSSFLLGEVLVKPPPKKYSNRNNQAVELIEKVIQHKDINRKESLDYLRYDKYEKIVFALSNINDKFEKLAIFRKFNFIFNNVDTTRIDGKDDLPLFMKETGSEHYYRNNPRSDKEIIRGTKTINLDEYIDNNGVTANLNYLYQNINIYDNNIFFMTNSFLSPVASTAPVLYRFYINDTLMVDDVRCIKLFFEPRNPADFLFHGFLFITDDGSFAIRKIDMSFNKKINIDWIKDVRIIQDFEKIGKIAWLLTKDDISIDFGATRNLPGILGHRVVTYSNYSINEAISDTMFIGPDVTMAKDVSDKSPMYWDTVRKPPLDHSEANIYSVIDSVKKVPAFKHRVNFLVLLTTNFLNLGKFEIGPDVSFLSYNPVEGYRLRFGGRTTPEFNKSIYLESYLAYGSNDKQYKYSFTATYSLLKTSIYKFPVKSIRINYQYDTKIPGQELMYSPPDNIFYSFKRGVNDKMFYNRTFGIEYINEFRNHFSFNLGYSFTRQSPGGNLYYTRSDSVQPVSDVPHINTPEIFLKLRYAPKEQFYQGKVYRNPVPSKYPVFQIHYTIGSKFLANDYNYQKIELDISKRFYFSIFGYTDVLTEAGKIFGKVPFPLLFIHNANQSYAYQKYSYNMMNFMEFVSDKYVSLKMDHSFNGFFFNKIPVLKKLKLREVATLKVLYGAVGKINNPYLQPDLFKYPSDNNGVPVTHPLGSQPYIEVSAGVSNIFRILRIDVVKRITYMGNPDVPSIGIRLHLKLDI